MERIQGDHSTDYLYSFYDLVYLGIITANTLLMTGVNLEHRAISEAVH